MMASFLYISQQKLISWCWVIANPLWGTISSQLHWCLFLHLIMFLVVLFRYMSLLLVKNLLCLTPTESDQLFASFEFRALEKPSSTYIFLCIIWLSSGNSTTDIRAVSSSFLSDWISLDFTSYIKMSWSLIFRYLTVAKLILPYVPMKAPIFFLQLNKVIHLFNVCLEINFVNRPVDHDSIGLFILFFPFAEISLTLVLEAVCWDASNARRYDVLNEFSFQFTLQRMVFWTELFSSIFFILVSSF